MFIYEYASGWADLVVGQLTASHETTNSYLWGYACLCIGRQFDPVIEDLYEEIDRISGKYLHVFSMLPPPKHILDKRIEELRRATESAASAASYKRLRRLRQSRYAYKDNMSGAPQSKWNDHRRTMVREKVQLLEELTTAGLKADQYADLLFFDFPRINEEDHVDIDVIAARQTPLEEGASSYKYIDLFQGMANKAEKHFRNGDSVESFVGDLSFDGM